MSLVTDKITATEEVNFALAGAVNSAALVDLGAVLGNTIIIVGTTAITNLGTALQPGVIRKMIFTDALTLTNSVNLVCFGNADITTEVDDIAEFVATTTTIWKMISYEKPSGKRDGRVNAAGLADDCVTVNKLNDACITPSKMMIKDIIDLADTTTMLSASDMVSMSIFKATPTANRSHATDTAVNIIAAVYSTSGYQIGTWFGFTIVNTSAFNETITAGAGVTLVGNMVCNNNSASFTCLITGLTTVSIFRK